MKICQRVLCIRTDTRRDIINLIQISAIYSPSIVYRKSGIVPPNLLGTLCYLMLCTEGTMLYLLNVLIMECDDCSGMQVPCILGVNLTHVDLLEFLQQVIW